MVEPGVLARIYRQMAALNKAARDVLAEFPVHACTDVTGFSLIGHSFEMAQGSGASLHILTGQVPFHPEAWELAEMGFIPAGAYRNREYTAGGVHVKEGIPLAMEDILYDPQTSGGLLAALPEKEGMECLARLADAAVEAAVVGYAAERGEYAIYLE